MIKGRGGAVWAYGMWEGKGEGDGNGKRVWGAVVWWDIGKAVITVGFQIIISSFTLR